ncbi:MAG: ATP-binding protein, partial [Alphaproteobacteria bacterium]|nr:ATP-binding protein [Alphaproteobacteria bacterium]
MAEKPELKLTYDPSTIEDLGFKIYSQIPNALAEFIANAYDADATVVRLVLNQKSFFGAAIEVIDNGCGMNFDDLNNKFLRIGRKRRKEHGQLFSKDYHRKVTGKKGLGKLALLGLASRVVFETKTKEMTESIQFTLDFTKFRDETIAVYKPEFSYVEKPDFESGTKIKLFDLTRTTDIKAEELAVSLSKLFQFFDKSFICTITSENGKQYKVNNSLRYASLVPNHEWKLPDFMENHSNNYAYKDKVTGNLFTTEKPLRSLRGITLFSNGRMVKPSSFFGKDSESSFFYSYITGDINVDFIDDFVPDVIGTGRQDIVWSSPEASELGEYLEEILKAVEKDWRLKE